MIRRILILLFALLAISPAVAAPTFPELTGRVVDQAELLSPEQEQALTQRLAALQQQNSRQLVVVTLPNLGGYEIEDYGVQLARHWRIGQQGADNGMVLIVAVQEHKVRVETGRLTEVLVPDILAASIIDEQMVPRFKQGDYPGGINAGVDALIAQLQATPEARERDAVAAQQRANERAAQRGNRHATSSTTGGIIWGVIILVIVGLAIAGGSGRGRRYRRGSGGSGIGEVLLWAAIDSALSGGRRGGGSSWGGGGDWGGGGGGDSGGGGGFSGGGGDFGGGGASGSW